MIVGATALALATVGGATAGLGVAVSTYVLHEWGHWLGAAATGSQLSASRSWWSLSLFAFDSSNSPGQFAAMSLAGFAVTGLAVVLVWFALPEGQVLTTYARWGVGLLATLTAAIEVPLFLYGMARRRTPAAVGITPPRR